MKPENTPVFKTKEVKEGAYSIMVKRMRDEDLSMPLELRDEMLPEPAVRNIRYITQISEMGGLQTCWPTSLLNQWAHQGSITISEAQTIQNRFKTDLRRLFKQRAGTDYHTLSMVPFEFPELIGKELSKTLSMYSLDTQRLSIQQVSKIILQEINKGNLIMISSDIHATMIMGYKNRGQSLVIRDPLNPNVEIIETTESIAKMLTEYGDPYLTVIPRNDIGNQKSTETTFKIRENTPLIKVRRNQETQTPKEKPIFKIKKPTPLIKIRKQE